MSYLDDFKARVNASGKTIAESQFNTTAAFINANFADSPFYRVVKVNGTIDLEVQLQDISSVTRSANVSLVQDVLKFMILKPNTSVNIGDMIELDGQFWMVSDYVSDNYLFPKAKIDKCNFELQLKTGETKTLKGYDNLKRPVYDIKPTYTNIHCILRTTLSSVQLNQAVNIPQGQVYITMQYNDIAKSVKENDEFDLYDRQYKVVGMDFSNIVNGVGCIMLFAERVVNT
jgi:hypothetical protein